MSRPPSCSRCGGYVRREIAALSCLHCGDVRLIPDLPEALYKMQARIDRAFGLSCRTLYEFSRT